MRFLVADGAVVESGSLRLTIVPASEGGRDLEGAAASIGPYSGAKLSLYGEWHDGDVRGEMKMLYVPDPPEVFVAPLQVVEETSYLVSLSSPTAATLKIPATGTGGRNPFQPMRFADGSKAVMRGILNWRSYVGRSRIVVKNKDSVIDIPVEVRSRKITYLDEYAELLDDIAEKSSRLMAEYASTTTVPFKPGSPRPSFLMEKFLVLEAAFASGWLQTAVEIVLHQPTTRLSRLREWVAAGEVRELDGTSIVRLAETGDVAAARGATSVTTVARRGEMEYVPSRLSVPSHTLSHDTAENRMVRHILEFLDELLGSLETSGHLNDFGQLRCSELREYTAAWLSDDRLSAFAGWRPPPQAPNTVLLRREGYRELYQLYLSLQQAGMLYWEEAELLYGQNVRPLSDLYEIWTLMAIAQALRDEFSPNVDLRLFKGGQVLRIRRGNDPVMAFSSGETKCALFYRREYSRARTGAYGSYSNPYTPDVTLVAETPSGHRLLLAFDAKYRYREVSEILAEGQAETAEASDLMKMHTYRDALGNCMGAYILFPGSGVGDMGVKIFQEGSTLLPSVGAFSLRPSKSPEQLVDIMAFIRSCLSSWQST